MEISGYENIEIFIKTQGFSINKYENQIIRYCQDLSQNLTDSLFWTPFFAFGRKKIDIFDMVFRDDTGSSCQEVNLLNQKTI
jgi:hypothetical protein